MDIAQSLLWKFAVVLILAISLKKFFFATCFRCTWVKNFDPPTLPEKNESRGKFDKIKVLSSFYQYNVFMEIQIWVSLKFIAYLLSSPETYLELSETSVLKIFVAINYFWKKSPP